MRLDKLAVTAQEAFQNAMGVAGEADAAVIEPIHLLKALLDSDENNLAAIVKRIGADPVWLSQNVADEIAKMPKQTGATPMAIPGQDLIKVIDNSVKIAEKLGDSYATSEHLLIALSGGRHPQEHRGGLREPARRHPRDLADRQDPVRSAGAVRSEPHPAGPRGQARSGYRP